MKSTSAQSIIKKHMMDRSDLKQVVQMKKLSETAKKVSNGNSGKEK